MRSGRVARFFTCCAGSVLVVSAWGMATASADSGRWHDGGGRSIHRHDRNHHHHGGRDRHDVIFVSATGSGSGWGGSCDHPDASTIQDGVNAAPVRRHRRRVPGHVRRGRAREQAAAAVRLRRDDRRHRAGERDPGGRVVGDRSPASLSRTRTVKACSSVSTRSPTRACCRRRDRCSRNVTDRAQRRQQQRQGVQRHRDRQLQVSRATAVAACTSTCTTHSVVAGNTVNGNADGVLLTDDYGPSSYNLVEGNTVNDNLTSAGSCSRRTARTPSRFDAIDVPGDRRQSDHGWRLRQRRP